MTFGRPLDPNMNPEAVISPDQHHLILVEMELRIELPGQFGATE